MTSLPYMQLYTSDYLADTAHLTTEEHGAYLLLLMNYWQRSKPLDNSNGRLAHVARLSAERWKEVEPVLAEFFIIDGDTWTQSRIERDLDKIRAKSSKLSANGLIGASKRLANAKQMLDFQEANAEQMPIYEEEDKEEEEDNKKIYSFDAFWKTYPRKTAKGAATAAWVKARKKASAEELISAAERYRDDPNRDPSFTAHASTWLNQERWLDDPLPARKLSPEDIKAQELAKAREAAEIAREKASRLDLEREAAKANAVPMPDELKKLIRVTQGT